MIEQGAAGDCKQIGCDVFEGEETSEDKLACEGETEGVDGGLWNEAGELDDEGCEGGDHRESCRVELWEQRRNEPVERDRPEKGAAVFIEEPRQAKWEHAPSNADGDSDEHDGKGGERAAHEGNRGHG